MLTLGSLFDGIGVFPYAAERNGILPVWASEIEKYPISITRRHFPNMLHLGDITKLDGGKIPAVHVLTFGSPCQNLSLCGTRTGLAGEKSSLFFQAIRIIQEMRDASGGKFPVICLWENVMGAFTSNDGMDFRAVLGAFEDTRFQCLLLETGQAPEWCEGDVLISPGGLWMPAIGQAPDDWRGGSGFSSWPILEGGALTKYCLSPAQCSHFLALAQRAGCPPPKEIEALLLKQGGVYPSSIPFSSTGCEERPSMGSTRSSAAALDGQQTLFPLY